MKLLQLILMETRLFYFPSFRILIFAHLCVQCWGYTPPCDRIIAGIVRPIQNSQAEIDKVRHTFEEELNALPKFDKSRWGGMPDRNTFNLAIEAGRRLCEARGILVESHKSPGGWSDGLMILPVLGISALNDFAYFQARVFSSRVVYSPMELVLTNFLALFGSASRTIYISHRSIATGRPQITEYHESDHGRLTHNLARGLVSIYHGKGTDDYLGGTIQEYATYPREINGRILKLRQVIRETSDVTVADIEVRARHILEIVQTIGYSICATGAPGAAVRWALKNIPSAKMLEIEMVRPNDGTHNIVWVGFASDDLSFAIRIPVLSLGLEERRPDPSDLRRLFLARLKVLQSIDQQFRERTLRLVQLILPPGIDLTRVLDRDAELQRQHFLLAQTFARSFSDQQVTEMVDLTSRWRNEIEVRMSTSFVAR